MSDLDIEFLQVGAPPNDRAIAVRASSGDAPGIVWLGGFKSDMMGTKAEALAAWANNAGRGCVRFDYSGHGQSEGRFTDGTIGRWLEEKSRRLRTILPWAAGSGRLLHGRLARAVARA